LEVAGEAYAIYLAAAGVPVRRAGVLRCGIGEFGIRAVQRLPGCRRVWRVLDSGSGSHGERNPAAGGGWLRAVHGGPRDREGGSSPDGKATSEQPNGDTRFTSAVGREVAEDPAVRDFGDERG